VKESPGATSFVGVIERRHEVPAAPKYSHAPSIGAFGTLMDSIAGTPRHYVYTILDHSKSENQVATNADYAIGACVRVWVVRDHATQWRWEFGKAQLEQATDC